MIFKIAICDDSPQNITEIEEQLVHYEMKYNIDFEISTFQSSTELLKSYDKPGVYHILFLDVEMPEMNGLELSKRIRQLPDRKAKIVFVSNYPEYMKDSFNVQAFHYLAKPFTREKCQEILSQIITDYEESLITKLLIQTDYSEELVYLENIVRIEYEDSKKKVLKVVLTDKTLQCKGDIHEWEEQLEEKGFVSPSRSHLINVRHLHFFQDHDLIMTNGDRVPLSRRREKAVRDLFNHQLLVLPK